MKINQRDKNGFRHGPWEDRHFNGNLHYKGTYKNGQLDGLCIAYKTNGKLWYNGEWKNDKRIGLWHQMFYND